MALTIYGSPRSRTMRVLWMAEELGLDYAHESWEFDDPRLKQSDFLHLNPAGAIPTIVDTDLVDDDLVLAESLAINLYLAKKYGNRLSESLYLDSMEGEAKIISWSLWAQGHLEPWIQKDRLLADLLKAIGNRADAMITRSLDVLEYALAGHRYLLGDRFTAADLNVAGVLSPSRARLLDLSGYPQVQIWLQRCYSRPAAIAVRQRFQMGI